jgi:predicted amidohydrolase YtcJ
MPYVFFNGNIQTMEDKNPKVESIFVNENKIVFCGSKRRNPGFFDNKSIKIDLKGKLLLPGFIDTHTHFYELAKKKIMIDLTYCRSVSDIEKVLKHFSKNTNPDLEWIGGSGWDLNIYPDAQNLNKHILDKYFPDIPISLESKDFHSKLCNSKALEIAKINRNTKNPKNGRIGKFNNGEPNGFTYEQAWSLIDKVVPPININLRKKIVIDTIQDMYKVGIIGVHSMEDSDKFHLYKELIDEGILFRFYWHFPTEDLNLMIKNGIKSYESGNEFLKYCGMKIFMDGSLGSKTALMFRHYPNEPDNFGFSAMNEEELFNLISFADKHGISSTIHAIGDKCNSIVIGAYNKLFRLGLNDRMHRIEHLQSLRLEDLKKIPSNVYCAFQPVHLKGDIPNIEKIWKNNLGEVYAFKTAKINKIKFGFGSDAPVETINPFEGIYAALERKFENNPKNESWHPNEKLDIISILKAYTIDAAFGSQSHEIRGSIEEGKLADLIIIDDYINESNEKWLTNHSYFTMINGKIVYSEI